MKSDITKKKLRQFGLIFGFGLPLFIGWLVPLVYGHNFKLWTLILASPFILLGTFKPNLLIQPFKFWMQLGLFLGNINSKIILSLIFFLILLPIALIMRLLGHDPLNKKRNGFSSYRENKKDSNIDFEKIF